MRASQTAIEAHKRLNQYQETATILLELYFVPASHYNISKVNVAHKAYKRIQQPADIDLITRHLKGEISIAALSSYSNRSKWVCIDIDTPNLQRVKDTRDALWRDNLSCYVSASGGKGYHLILFFDGPVTLIEAQEMSRKVSRIAQRVGLEFDKISPSPYGQGGDCIKLPLGIHPDTGNKCPFLDDDMQPVSNPLEFLKSIQRVQLSQDNDKITKNTVNTKTGEIPISFPSEISQRFCINKLWIEGIQAPNTRHSATLTIANSLVRARDIPDKDAAIVDWVLRTYPRAQENGNVKITSDIQYEINETQRLLHLYQKYGTVAELCENQLFKPAMRSACENEFECKLNQNHGHVNLELLLRIGVFNAVNAKPKGIGKSAMALYLAIGLVASSFTSFTWKGMVAFSLSTQQLVCLSNCSKQTVIKHRKKLLEIGLLFKVPIRDIPSDVLQETPYFARPLFYALPDLTVGAQAI